MCMKSNILFVGLAYEYVKKVSKEICDGFDMFLPRMKSDVMLSLDNKILIIDAIIIPIKANNKYELNLLKSIFVKYKKQGSPC